jgi:hypothetical protein
VLPTSQLPEGLPSLEMVIIYSKVGAIAKQIRITAPKYFPKIMFPKEIGLVIKSSKVPIFFSSLKDLIVTAGIKNNKTQGAIIKKEDKSAKPLSKILNSPGINQSRSPFSNKKNAMTIKPTGVEKKELISLFSIANIVF